MWTQRRWWLACSVLVVTQITAQSSSTTLSWCLQATQAVANRRFAFKASRAGVVVVRAEAADASSPSTSAMKPIHMAWPKDNETIKDVFAFGGSAPEVSACAQ